MKNRVCYFLPAACPSSPAVPVQVGHPLAVLISLFLQVGSSGVFRKGLLARGAAVAELSPGPASRGQQRAGRVATPQAPAEPQPVTLRAGEGRGGGGAARRSLLTIGCRAGPVPPLALTTVSLALCQAGVRCACAAGATLAGGVGASAGAAAGGERERGERARERGGPEPRARAGSRRRHRRSRSSKTEDACLPLAASLRARHLLHVLMN